MSLIIRMVLLVCSGLLVLFSQGHAIGRQVAPRDYFPVFKDPVMYGAEEAERLSLVLPGDAVIGVYRDGQAKAYPVSIMGVHELGNDTIAGLPIVVGW